MHFPGGFTQTPHIISDAMREMSWPEWVCTDVLVRETFGWQRPWARLTQADFLQRTPIKSRATVIKALKAVEARGFFRRTESRSVWVIGEMFGEGGE